MSKPGKTDPESQAPVAAQTPLTTEPQSGTPEQASEKPAKSKSRPKAQVAAARQGEAAGAADETTSVPADTPAPAVEETPATPVITPAPVEVPPAPEHVVQGDAALSPAEAMASLGTQQRAGEDAPKPAEPAQAAAEKPLPELAEDPLAARDTLGNVVTGKDTATASVPEAGAPADTLREPGATRTASGRSTVAPPPPPPPPAERESRSVFLPALLGGLIAAGLGAAAVLYLFPQGLKGGAGDETALHQQLAAQSSQLAALTSEMQSLRSAAAAPAGLEQMNAALTAKIDALQQQLDAANAAGAQGAADIEARLRDAQDAAKGAQARAAVSHLLASLDAGTPLTPSLGELQAAGVSVPDTLGASADGVPSLADLQRDYPAAARAGLAASLPVSAQAGTWNRIGAFLQAQTGARSLTPQQGSGPDAVLSRAEAALRDGDVPGALSELAGLPEPGQTAMADWTAEARARVAALEAARTLASGLN